MDYDYSNRSGLLPSAITERGFVVTVPHRQITDVAITVEGSNLRVTAKQVGSYAPFDSTIQVPSGYAAADARPIYYEGQMRIVVPKTAA